MTRALLIAALACVACGTARPAREPGGPPERPRTVRLYVFDCGTLDVDPARFRLAPEEVAVPKLAVPCFLVAHPNGTLVWDPGAVPDAEWTPTGSPVRHHVVFAGGGERDVTLTTPFLAQLAAAGYAPGDVTHLALSHYHYDHTANANAFAGATWLVRRAEREAMFAATPPPITRPSTYSALRDSRTILIEDDEHDLFGDGAVVIKAAPGHTPGHQVLYVRLARHGAVVLSGDLYHFPEARTLGRVATFDFDQRQSVATRAAIEAFLMRTGATLWIQHDFAGNARLRKAPAYYE